MNKLILHRKDGTIRTVKWGSVPSEFHESRLFDVKFNDKEPTIESTTSTMPKRTFYLTGLKKEGWWLWKHQTAIYEEKD